MDYLTIAAFVATALLGLIGGWAFFGKSKDVAKEVGELLINIHEFLDEKSEEGKGLSKKEVAQLLADVKEVWAALKA